MTFSMTWFSFIFPNTALISATFAIGKAFSSKTIDTIGLVSTVALIVMYIYVCFMMVRAIKLRHILWEQNGEGNNNGDLRMEELVEPETLR
jgi:tellurite resistance protein TehA-like permease